MNAILEALDARHGEMREWFEHLHRHPELSMQEHRTADIAAAWLRQQGYEVTEGVGGTGVVGLLRNGDGEAVYRRCAVTEHHHHLLCRSCGKAVEVEAPAVETWAARTAQEHGFTEVAHTVEIYGLCPDCTARKAAAQ